MMINRRMVCGGKSLPYDAEIEYLESSGTQKINTGIVNTTPTKYILRGAKTRDSVPMKSGFFGSNNWIYSLFFYTAVRNIRWTNSGNCYDYNGVQTYTFYNIECNKEGAMYVNGATTARSGDSNSGGGNIFLFVGASYSNSYVRIASFKMYSDSTLLRDYIPVRVGNVGYMYDKVSGQLFGNAGTGSFIVGPGV